MILPAAHETSGHHAAALELADRFARAQELAGQVHADHRVPLRERQSLERRVLLQPGVVDEDVDVPNSCSCGRTSPGPRLRSRRRLMA